MAWAWHLHGVDMAWTWHDKCESDTAELCTSNGRERHSKLLAARHAMCESALRMQTAVTLIPLSAFMAWAEATLPFATSCHPLCLRFI